MANSQVEPLSVEDKSLRSKFKTHPFLLVFGLIALSLCLIFSVVAALLAPFYRPVNYVEGYSLFDHLIPIIIIASLSGAGLFAYLVSTVTRSISYGGLPAAEFRKRFLPTLTAVDGWSVKGQSEKYLLYRQGETSLLISFEKEQMLVQCPLRFFPKVKVLAARASQPEGIEQS